MNKKSVKQFIAEHKEDIEIVAAIAGVFVCGAIVGRSMGVCSDMKKGAYIVDKDVRNIFKDIHRDYSNQYTCFTGVSAVPLGPDKLGTVGETIVSLGGANEEFTHVIMLGKKK